MMATNSVEELQVGDRLPALTFGPITRHTLALYCGGSGDHNPIHVDSDFAKAAGFDDVFAHGMLSMAVLGRVLTGWVPQDQVRSFNVRFTSITHVDDVVTCHAAIKDKKVENAVTRLCLDVHVQMQDGQTTLSGNADIEIPASGQEN